MKLRNQLVELFQQSPTVGNQMRICLRKFIFNIWIILIKKIYKKTLIIEMQPGRQMQTRDNRMLKTSMIVQPTTNSNKRISSQMYQNYPMPNIKTFPSFLSNEPIQLPNMYSQQQRQQQFQSQHNKEEGHIQRPNDPFITQIYSELQRLSRLVDKHELQISAFNFDGDISKRLLNQIKKNLPAFTGGNDVYDHILTMKLQIKGLQQQLTRMPRINDLDTAVKKQFQVYQKNNQNSSTNSSLSGSSVNKNGQLDPLLGELLKKRDEYFNKVIVNIDTEVSMLKKNLSNYNLQMKVTPITSSSCIILKYQQLFKARNKNQNDMVLSETTYYIDNEGFLLDCHSRYIVDQKGKKIKLEEKHLNMLKNQKILQ